MAVGYSVWCTPDGVQARQEGPPTLSPESTGKSLMATVHNQTEGSTQTFPT